MNLQRSEQLAGIASSFVGKAARADAAAAQNVAGKNVGGWVKWCFGGSS